MASKNEIKHRISLEGDDDVKRRLRAVGEAGKQALADTEKRLGAARSFAERQSAGGPAIGALNKLRAPAEALGGALSPFAEGAGVAGLLGRLKGFFTSPAGIYGTIGTALAGIALHLAKVSGETERAQGRFKALGDNNALGKLSDQAKKFGTDISTVQQRYERFLVSEQGLNAKNRSFIHPPGYQPSAAEASGSGVQVLGAGPSKTPTSRGTFLEFDRALFEQIRRDVGNSDEAKQIAGQFEDSLGAGGLTGDLLRSLQQSAPNAANFVTKSLSGLLGRGFNNPAELAALIDRGSVQVSGPDVIRQGAKLAPESDKEARAARGVTEALEGLTASIGRFDKAVAETFGKPIDKGLASAVDKVTDGINRAADDLPAAVQRVRTAAQQPGAAFQQANPFIGATNQYKSPGEGETGASISKAAGEQKQAAAEQKKAAGDLKAAGALPTVTYGQKKSSGEELATQAHSEEVHKAIDKFRHFNGGLIDFQKVDPEAAALIRGMDDRGDGSVPGQAPDNESQLSRMLANQKQLGELEGLFQEKLNPLIADQTGEGADSIERERSKQRGMVGGADLSERLYPEGPSNLRYRRLDDPNYQPPELGTYDENMNFVPAKKQPYPKVPGLNNVYDTKGFGDFNPIYNSGAPNPLSFPHYIEELRKSLSPEPVPLPQSRPDEAPPPEQHSAIDDQQEVADNATAFNKALDDAGDGLKRFVSILADVRSGQNSDAEGKPKTVTFATGGPVARWFDGGGHVSGPGTTTSDSIPAWLSDKEYVIQASAAKKVGRGFLDWVNAGAPGFADGGSVIGSSTGGVLGPGSHDITYDPLSGGAYIDGNLHLPGDPLLDDPIVKQAMQESMRGMGQQPSQRKHKSDFTGIFGGHVFDTPGSFAGGGAVGSIPSLRSYFARFAGGGGVAGGLNIGAPALPQISMPTLDFGDVPDFGDLASNGPSEAMHHVTIDLGGGRSVDGLRAPTDIVKQLSREAKDSANARIGVAPSWVYGRGR